MEFKPAMWSLKLVVFLTVPTSNLVERNCGVAGPKPISSDWFCLDADAEWTWPVFPALLSGREGLKSLGGIVSLIVHYTAFQPHAQVVYIDGHLIID